MPGFLLAALAMLGLFVFGAAHSPTAGSRPESARQVCQRLGTADSLRPIPPGLVAAAREMFGLQPMPTAQIRRATVYRCLDSRVEMCNYGANLPCGKANLSASLPAAKPWCQAHPDSHFIPFYISGHNSIYRWHCTGGVAVAGGPVAAIDRRGFLARFWRTLPLSGE